MNEETVKQLTNTWIHEVTVNNNPQNIYQLFCSDGSLIGTVSQIIRYGKDIENYFEYFAKLKNIQVIKKEYVVSKVCENVYVNTAFMMWSWDGLESPITTRMTFIYKNKCIFQLHSSMLPGLNENLKLVSGKY